MNQIRTETTGTKRNYEYFDVVVIGGGPLEQLLRMNLSNLG